MKIILLEDDPTLSFGVRKYLVSEGHEVLSYFSLSEALYSDREADLYLVDIALPDGNGYEYVELIRKTSSTPIIFLTAKDDEESVLKGFDVGADDYIVKPFSLRELKRRIDAITRRVASSILTLGSLRVDTQHAVVAYDTTVINLSVQEYRILILLLRNKEKYITREILTELLWESENNVSDNTLNVTIRRLRSKLSGYANIETVHGKGYRITL